MNLFIVVKIVDCLLVFWNKVLIICFIFEVVSLLVNGFLLLVYLSLILRRLVFRIVMIFVNRSYFGILRWSLMVIFIFFSLLVDFIKGLVFFWMSDISEVSCEVLEVEMFFKFIILLYIFIIIMFSKVFIFKEYIFFKMV